MFRGKHIGLRKMFPGGWKQHWIREYEIQHECLQEVQNLSPDMRRPLEECWALRFKVIHNDLKLDRAMWYLEIIIKCMLSSKWPSTNYWLADMKSMPPVRPLPSVMCSPWAVQSIVHNMPWWKWACSGSLSSTKLSSWSKKSAWPIIEHYIRVNSGLNKNKLQWVCGSLPCSWSLALLESR